MAVLPHTPEQLRGVRRSLQPRRTNAVPDKPAKFGHVVGYLYHANDGASQEIDGGASGDDTDAASTYCRSGLLCCFNDAREAYFKKNKEFAGGASEMIVCLPAVRFWLEVTPGLGAAIPARVLQGKS